ncbi:MAG: hypothetical protein CMJ35_11315 [Phycisphaerae bacterium]|nr:hypothetical protein [Phycisphaerae bacterium]MBM92181.1 hypothetical protein [Phycisphaerae bacterium]HCT44019.1 hypothetical protein [Phycisphaerales bacterium]|tara:strand:+ start:701 stop:949 length:249 start_codon:yes stop_codon:yes gene_type:complete
MQTRFFADRSRPCPLRVVLPVVLAALPLCLVGCQKTALRPDDTRSQFDRYDQSRSQRAQPFLEDEFGRRTPNLKARLLVSDE